MPVLRSLLWCFTTVLLLSVLSGLAMAQQATVQNYTSKNFLIHSDLTPEEAKELLEKLETMLGLISKYWGQPNRQPIECYIVKDLNNWSPNLLAQMDPGGLEKIRSGAGVTIRTTRTQGTNQHSTAIVYAKSDRGTPMHEAVHAYCGQTFHTTGPLWYSEGMAELGSYWVQESSAVNCEEYVVKYIRGTEPKTLNAIVNSTAEQTGDSWENYSWRWALCHLLAYNPNYAPRFRPLGMGLLTRQNVSFEQIYGNMAEEISFEYLFFLQHLDRGFRVDLCAWDWKTRFRTPRGSSWVSAKIDSAGGWQASKVLVQEGDTLEFITEGDWQLGSETDAEKLTAAGDAGGQGKLLGIIFHDFKLSEPFELGEGGTFTVPGEGKLFLRCQDEWNSLADNKGSITVKIRPAGKN